MEPTTSDGTSPAPDESTPAPTDALRAELDELRKAVNRNDRQIDDLQVRAAENERPWYRNVQTLVAVFALLLSLATTLTSAYWARTQEDVAEARIRQQEIQDAKAELRELLQALAELTRRTQALPASDNGNGSEVLQNSYASEMSLLTNQAIAVVYTIPDYVSSSEYLAIALQLGNLGDYQKAGPLLESALANATTPFDKLSAARTYGIYLYGQGDVEGGRSQMQQSLDVWNEFTDVARQAPLWPKLEDLITYMFWAGYEAMAGNCDVANEQSTAASNLWLELMPPLESPLQQQYNDMWLLIGACVPGGTPVVPVLPTYTPLFPADNGLSPFEPLFPTPISDWFAWETPEAPFSQTLYP